MIIREAECLDLQNLLILYTQLHDTIISKNDDVLQGLWEKILRDENHHIIVAIEKKRIISSCVVMIIPNLTHGQRPYALIENVVTDVNYRKQGIATACLNYAKTIASKENCYKIMLLTGAKDDSTLKFYEEAGFNRHDKTAFIQWLE